MKINTLIPVILILFFTGCATPAYKEVFQAKKAYNTRRFCASYEELYQATLQALCAKNFIIEKEDKSKGFILAKRAFPRGKRNIMLLIQGKIVPLEDENYSVLYLNAIETTEISYISDHTRFFMFIFPLPGGGGKEATTIKEKEKTIQDIKFYNSFFKLIQDIIQSQARIEEAEEYSILILEKANPKSPTTANVTQESNPTKPE